MAHQAAIPRFQLHEEIGRGGMGVVFRATCAALPGEFAVKCIRPELADDPAARERFLREAATAASLRHPHIVRTFDAFTGEHGLSLPMELLRGRSLAALLAAEPGPWPWPRALHIAAQAAAGVAHAHAAGVLHRDLKPANIFVSTSEGAAGAVKVLDFGLARGLGDLTLTSTGMTVGTPEFLAPELLEGARPAPAADVYALGVVLFRMLTGRLPVVPPEGAPLLVVLMAIARAHEVGLPRLARLRPEIPPELDRICARALARYPALRPRDAGELAAALRAIRETTTAPSDAALALESRFAVPTLGEVAARAAPVATAAAVPETRFAVPALGSARAGTATGAAPGTPAADPLTRFEVPGVPAPPQGRRPPPSTHRAAEASVPKSVQLRVLAGYALLVALGAALAADGWRIIAFAAPATLVASSLLLILAGLSAFAAPALLRAAARGDRGVDRLFAAQWIAALTILAAPWSAVLACLLPIMPRAALHPPDVGSLHAFILAAALGGGAGWNALEATRGAARASGREPAELAEAGLWLEPQASARTRWAVIVPVIFVANQLLMIHCRG